MFMSQELKTMSAPTLFPRLSVLSSSPWETVGSQDRSQNGLHVTWLHVMKIILKVFQTKLERAAEWDSKPHTSVQIPNCHGIKKEDKKDSLLTRQ